MKFETKYDVGHTYWVARVYKRYKRDSLVLNGQVYTNETTYFEPLAKKKIIVGVHIHNRLNSEGETTLNLIYNVVDYDRRNDSSYMLAVIRKDNYERMFSSEEAAMEYARSYKDNYTGELYKVAPIEKWEI